MGRIFQTQYVHRTNGMRRPFAPSIKAHLPGPVFTLIRDKGPGGGLPKSLLMK